MGWMSATEIFDTVIRAAKEVLDEVNDQYSDHIPRHEMLVHIAKPLAEELESGDWDTQQESDFWDELKWDVFPDLAKQEEEDRLYDL